MTKTRGKFDAALKAKIAVEALREQATANDPAQRRQVRPRQIHGCKQRLGQRGAWRSTPRSGRTPRLRRRARSRDFTPRSAN
jgi:hypothetical protein